MKPIDTPAPKAFVLLTLLGDTLDLVRSNAPDAVRTITYPLSRRASIKDILESLGVPHTEIGRIVLDGQEQTFEKIAEAGEHFEIHPLSSALPPTRTSPLRPVSFATCVFLVDINVGRLGGLLRMAGFDAEAVASGSTARDIVLKAVREERILLTRNRDLLKQRRLVFGRLVRNQDPDRQLKEVIDLYGLQNRLRPFSRCIACNGLLLEVTKDAILDRLLPLTKKYYHEFKQCSDCGKIYWRGSHHDKMACKLATILGS